MTRPRLGSFILDHPIARGGIGQIWRGRHSIEGLTVAVKVMNPGALGNRGRLRTRSKEPDEARLRAGLRRFRREVQAVAALDHPGIIHVLDFGIADSKAQDQNTEILPGSPYIVMEHASGGSLSEMPPVTDWSMLRGVILAVLDSLAHAHARNVLHRDVKASNVLVCTSSDLRPGLKLTDFGLASIIGQEPGDEVLEGTAPYMSPEQIRGDWRAFGPSTDLYALGCMVWKLATGDYPFGALRGPALLRAHLETIPTAFSPRFPVPLGFRSWLTCLLAKPPEDRFSFAADAVAALTQLDGTTTPIPTRISSTPSPLLPFSEPTTLAGPHSPQVSATRHTDRRLLSQSASASGHFPDWMHPVPPSTSIRLIDAGLRLFGARDLRLVGRHQERGAVWDVLSRTSADASPRAVLVKGVGGIGKSALARWAGRRAHELGLGTLIEVTHSPTTSATEALRQSLVRRLRLQKLSPSEMRDALTYGLDGARLSAAVELLRTEKRSTESPPLTLELERERHAATLSLLDLLSQDRTLIVLLDDVQWGSESIGLVHYTLDQPPQNNRRILFLLTAQDEDVVLRPQERIRLQALEKRKRVRTLQLGPLVQQDRRELVRNLLFLQSTLAAKVERQTEGNPLFAIQLVGDWIERDLLSVSDTGFQLKSEPPALPDTLHAVWNTRLERLFSTLPPDAVAAIERAAALGLEIDMAEWMDATGSGVKTLDGALEALLGAELAAYTDEGWRFTHAICRAALERRAREGERWKEHHSACARMLRKRHGQSVRVAERLGRHLLAAGHHDDALDRILVGVAQLQSRSGYRPSLALLGDAEDLMNQLAIPAASHKWGKLWLTRAGLLKLQGEYDESLTWARYAERGAREALSSESAIASGEAGRWESVLRGSLCQQAQILLRRHQLSQADPIIEEVLKRASSDEDAQTLGVAYYVKGAAAYERRDYDNADHYQSRAVECFRNCQNDIGIADALSGMGNNALHRRDLQRADHLFRQSLTLHERHGRRIGIAHVHNGLAEVARLREDFAAAERGYVHALELFDAMGAGQAVVPRLNLGLVMLRRGNYEAARASIERARSILESQDRLGLLGAADVLLLPSLAFAQDWPGWDRALQEARLLLLQTGLGDSDVAWAARLAGDLASDARQSSRSLEAYQLASIQYEQLGMQEQIEALAYRVRQVIRF